jgi:hypothetical protein
MLQPKSAGIKLFIFFVSPDESFFKKFLNLLIFELWQTSSSTARKNNAEGSLYQM